MEKMSVTRALSQLKLLDSRILKEIGNAEFIGFYQSGKNVIQGLNIPVNEFEKLANATKQTISDLIDRRRKIKSAVLLSNSNTSVIIDGEKYFVIEAIERKMSIKYDEALFKKLRLQYTTAMSNLEQNNAKIKENIDRMLEANLQKDKEAKKSDYENITHAFIEANEVKLSDPIKIKTEIDLMDEKIDTFLSEVDFVLSESNSRTEIEF